MNNVRLKLVREIVVDTQREFAERVGVSCQYVLSVETGQRVLSRTLAERCALAVGIDPDWLLGAGRADHPIDCRGERFTRWGCVDFLAMAKRNGMEKLLTLASRRKQEAVRALIWELTARGATK